MNHLHIAAQLSTDKDFVDYVYLSGTLDPVVLRLLKIVNAKESWQEEFDDIYDTPGEVAQELDNVKCDLRSAEEMIKEQAEEIKRLSTRTVIELLADQETKLKWAERLSVDHKREYERERDMRKVAEEKLQVWGILQN